jgi:hypothetical protein
LGQRIVRAGRGEHVTFSEEESELLKALWMQGPDRSRGVLRCRGARRA